MIIGISGKIGSGKDTVGQIIQYLTSNYYKDNIYSFKESLVYIKKANNNKHFYTFKIKKFADALKDMICILIGCTREQLEDRDFKEKELGEEWRKWFLFMPVLKSINKPNRLPLYYNSREEAKEAADIILKNTKTKYVIGNEVLTLRLLLQLLGTECGRNIIHPNIWVNALFSQYKSLGIKEKYLSDRGNLKFENIYPNWIITDMRFPNELQAVKDRGGITIRINRPKEREIFLMNANITIDTRKKEHLSEIALDNAEFDYTIDNNGTIEELVEKVKEILIKEKVLFKNKKLWERLKDFLKIIKAFL